MVGQNQSKTQLRSEIDFLGTKLGQVIKQFEGEEVFEIVEKLRLASRDHRSGNAAAGLTLHEIISGLEEGQ